MRAEHESRKKAKPTIKKLQFWEKEKEGMSSSGSFGSLAQRSARKPGQSREIKVMGTEDVPKTVMDSKVDDPMDKLSIALDGEWVELVPEVRDMPFALASPGWSAHAGQWEHDAPENQHHTDGEGQDLGVHPGVEEERG